MMDDASRIAWLRIGAATLASCIGSSIIWIDKLWNSMSRHKVSILNNHGFLIASLALSSGVLGTTALNGVLPEAFKFIDRSDRSASVRMSHVLVLVSFVVGIVLCLGLNFLIHIFTSQSVVHCVHDVGGDYENRGHSHSHGNGHSHSRGHSHGQPQDEEHACAHWHSNDDQSNIFHDHGNGHSHSQSYSYCPSGQPSQTPSTSNETPDADEQTPLMVSVQGKMGRGVEQHFTLIATAPMDADGEIHSSRSLLDRTTKILLSGKCYCVGTCRGFQSLQACASELHRELSGSLTANDPDLPVADVCIRDEESHPELVPEEDTATHHHHVVPQFGQLFSIGLQTALAIAVHKIPEGFILFATTRANQHLGLRVFFALAVHNFFEGFTIATPLYLALESRSLACVFAFLLGGGSQPLGALLALVLLPNRGLDDSSYLEFGEIMAGTGGFMTTISFQMIATAVDYGGSQQQVVTWAILGAILVFALACF